MNPAEKSRGTSSGERPRFHALEVERRRFARAHGFGRLARLERDHARREQPRQHAERKERKEQARDPRLPPSSPLRAPR